MLDEQVPPAGGAKAPGPRRKPDAPSARDETVPLKEAPKEVALDGAWKVAARPLFYGGYPPVINPIVIVNDRSGSMSEYDEFQGDHITKVVEAVLNSGGQRALERLYVLRVVMALEGVLSSGFVNVAQMADLPHTPFGETPHAAALDAVCEELESFISTKLTPNGVRCMPPQILWFGDLKQHSATETHANVLAAVKRLTDLVRKYRGRVTLVVPSEEGHDKAMAALLNVNEQPVRYLNGDPAAVVRIVFETLTSA